MTEQHPNKNAKLLAFYLPQYHTIPENDAWWGKGFTDWTNVRKAAPLIPGHYQPHAPAELGYYDLRDPEIRERQAALAAEHGIDGFCYYHYWFDGKRLLESPFEEVLQSGKPDFPFCLCWANENWTRSWDGRDKEILMKQVYSEADDERHIEWLIRAFRDPRYIRIDGKPLFLVYRASRIPTPLQTMRTWRVKAREAGVGEIYLCKVESFPEERSDPAISGFDAAVEFQPEWGSLAAYQRHRGNHFLHYADLADGGIRKPSPAYPRHSCVVPSWDNSARRQKEAFIFTGATPSIYQRWLEAALQQADGQPEREKIVFINAWNEWAEGNHLEPCQKWGRAYLEATKRAVQNTREVVS